MITLKQIFKKTKELNINYEQENMVIAYLDEKCNLIDLEVLFVGGCDRCGICVKTLFRRAMKKNTSSLHIAHNHPYKKHLSQKKNLKESKEDIEVFNQVVSAGELMGIPVLSWMIFNKKGFESYGV